MEDKESSPNFNPRTSSAIPFHLHRPRGWRSDNQKQNREFLPADRPHKNSISPKQGLKSSPQGTKRKFDMDESDGKTDKYHPNAQNSAPVNHKRKRQPKRRLSKPEQPPRVSEERLQLLKSRSSLPIWPHVTPIRLALRGERYVLILIGETGSGKSTQVPQLLMTEAWCTRAIAVTQPRRVAAISLARRVAEEVGTPLGKHVQTSQVGYSVRFDQNFSPNTKIKFLTEGMLLQELLRDPLIRSYSLVVVDEVHERSVNVDLILGFLKNILHEQMTSQKPPSAWRKGAGPLKVVVMSATADTVKFFQFFDDIFRKHSPEPPVHSDSLVNMETTVNGEYNNNKNYEETAEYSESSWSGVSSSESDANDDAVAGSDLRPQTVTADSDHISTIYVEGRQHPVQTLFLPDPTSDYLGTALKTIIQVHYKEPIPGDILVFLPGQDTIEALTKSVKDHAEVMESDVPKVLTIPLYAGLPQKAQQKAFLPTPPNTRKVIIATNIAETSLTIPGVAHVIDTGLQKFREFRPRLGMETLLVKPISQTNAIQRKGRAGRQGPGKCYRLYTEDTLLNLKDAEAPEILRCDLADAVLTMKSRRIVEVDRFPFLDPPESPKLRKAHLSLLELGAVDETAAITKVGKKMAKLPLPPHLARVLLVAAQPEYNCLLDMIDIVACMAGENIFEQLGNEEAKEEAAEARRGLVRREGDHMTMHAAVQAYAALKSDWGGWCRKHLVSARSMRNVMEIRKQLREQCQAMRLVDEAALAEEDSERNADGLDPVPLLKALLKGFSTNVASLQRDGSYKSVAAKQPVAIHPSSTLFGRQRRPDYIMYSEFVFTGKCWARSVSEVDPSWLTGIAEVVLEVNGNTNTNGSI